MKKRRAIYIGDVRFDNCPVFELNEENNDYEMLIDKEIRYSKEAVEELESQFIIFEVEDNEAKIIKFKENLS